MVNENSFEIGRIFVMEGSRQVLVKVMLFQSREPVHPKEGTMPNFFYKSRSSLLVLLIDVSFVSKFFWKRDKKFKNLTSGQMHMEDPSQTTSYFSFNFPDRSFMLWLRHPPKMFLVLSSNSESNISFKNCNIFPTFFQGILSHH